MQQAGNMAWLNYIKSQKDKESNHIVYKLEGEEKIENVAFNFNKISEVLKLIDNKAEINLLKFYPELLQLSQSAEEKSVCAKTVNRGETIVECYDCRMDSSCIICLDCYNNGDHKGHKVIFKKAFGGCCDCGDIQAWKQTGFCKNHSGQVKDIVIDDMKSQQFCKIMEDILYVYYREVMKKQNIKYLLAVIDLCKSIIEQGITGIKLLSVFFASTMPVSHKFNSKLQEDTILSHLLTFQFVGGEGMREWENVFINMFPLYEFKKQLLATYVKYFVRIYKGDSSMTHGQSLSCQILTSYKLVQDYIENEHSLPLGHNINELINERQDYGFILAADLDKINSLQGDTPYKYWKFYINHSIDSIFSHYAMLRSLLRKQKEGNIKNAKKDKRKKKKQNVLIDQSEQYENWVIQFIKQRCPYSQNEVNCIKIMNFTLEIISKDKALLRKLLLKMYQLIREDIEEDLIIFRPYDRVFCLTLFYYIQRDVSFLRKESNINQLRIDLGLTSQQWKILQSRIFNRMMTTYFFYAHILINDNKGQKSSYLHYLYFYSLKENLTSNVDNLLLKMTALMTEQTYESIELPFDQLLRIKDSSEMSWSLALFTAFMEEIGLLYTGKTSEIYVAHSVERHIEQNYAIFTEDILTYLKKFISSQGGSSSFQRISEFAKGFLFNDQDILKKRLREICEFNKEKKIFELKEHFKDPEPINFQDFYLRTKLVNKNREAQNPKNTLNLITDYNREIFSYVWSIPNLKSLRKIMLQLNQKLQNQKNKQQLVKFYTIVCKFVYLLQNVIGNTEKIQIIRELIIIMDISPEIKKELKSYSDLLGEQEESTQSSTEGNQKIVDKKEEMRLKMLKKREELSKKNQNNMLKAQEIHVEELKKINSEKVDEEGTNNQNEQKYCVICRNKQEQSFQLVYLAKLFFRDLQLLLQMGRGVKTLSFTTCYHSFHYDCIQRSAVATSNFDIVFKCPICRKAGNTFFPVDPLIDIQKSKPFVESCLERIMQVIMTFKNYTSIDAVEELIKSFYHYALLGMFQPTYLKKKRRNLYKVIFKMLSADYLRGSVLLVKQKLKSSTLTVRPKMMKNPGKKVVIERKADSSSQSDYNSDSDEEIELEGVSNEERLIEMLNELANRKGEQKSTPKERMVRKNSEKKSKEFTNNFIYVVTKVIEEIQKSSLNKQKEAIIEEKQAEIEVRQELKDVLNDLFTEGYNLNFPPLKIKLQELPETYSWDMTKNVCEQCKNICHDTMACLLCNWRGCLNCKQGGLTKHTRETHGEVSPVMRVNDSQSYLISFGEIRKVGPLYANYYGDSFNIKRQWSEYFLQHAVQEELQAQLLKDE